MKKEDKLCKAYRTGFYLLVIVIIVMYCFSHQKATAQKIYYASSKLTADVCIYFTKSKLDADASIYFTETKMLLGPGLSTWYISKTKSDSDFTVFITQYRSEAGLIIHNASSALCARWRNSQGKALVKNLIR